jgi:hypothetical protein
MPLLAAERAPSEEAEILAGRAFLLHSAGNFQRNAAIRGGNPWFFAFPEQQIPQRVCSENLLQSDCRSVTNLLIVCTVINLSSSELEQDSVKSKPAIIRHGRACPGHPRGSPGQAWG